MSSWQSAAELHADSAHGGMHDVEQLRATIIKAKSLFTKPPLKAFQRGRPSRQRKAWTTPRDCEREAGS